jgi:PKD repeat protein
VTRGRLSSLVVSALVAAACTDAAGPPSAAPRRGLSTTSGTGITLDQQTSVLNDGTPWGQGETHVGKGFQPANPHLGDAIVATFFWRGTTNTIGTVADHLCNPGNTPVGNTYTLVDYVTAGGYSMATYVATNVQGFPDPATTSEQLLCVHAIFSNGITEGGEMLSAYQGVASATSALSAFHSATGSGSTTTVADPGAIAIGTGALAYAVTMSDTVVGTDPPAGFTVITDVSDSAIKADGEYEIVPNAGSVDPTWNWYFTSAHSWLATVLALNPATATNQPPVAAFTSSCSGLTCSFTSTSSDPDGTIGAYSWTFGDGGTSTVQNPSRTYATAGTFTVTLTVTDNQGATNTASHTVTVTAPNTAPVVNAGPNQTVVVGLLYTLSASFTDPDNGPWTYTINWGDGSSSRGSRSTQGTFYAGHTYVVPLTSHTVTVTVTDSRGASGHASKVVTVLL